MPTESVPSLFAAEQILWRRRDMVSTPMHVLKLVYLAHGWMLGLYSEPLINESAEAWRYGPVVPSVYHCYKSFRGDPILHGEVDRTDQLDPHQTGIIDQTCEGYGQFTALQLSSLTHKKGTPWDITYRAKGLGAPIPNELILQHYQRLADRHSDDAG